MIGIEPLFTVHRNGEYMGMVENEESMINVLPSPYFYDDDCITLCRLDVNRFHVDGAIVKDKFTNEVNIFTRIPCRTEKKAKKLCHKLNLLNLKKERLEAQIRAKRL